VRAEVDDAAVPLLPSPGELDTFAGWWQNPLEMLRTFGGKEHESSACEWYQIVDALVGVESEDVFLRRRFQALYGEFLAGSDRVSDNLKKLYCRVQTSSAGPILVTFVAPHQIDIAGFILSLFTERGYVEIRQAATGWRFLGMNGKTCPFLAANGSHALVDAREQWQALVASCIINWAMLMQPELLFFHAASIGIDGAGVLISGEKGLGKTTISMALAAHGHAFLGDEIAAVRTRTKELASFRRAISVRPGTRSPQVERLLGGRSYPTEHFPDGTTRLRVKAAELFPEVAAGPLPIRSIFFLSGFEDHPRAEAFAPRTTDVRLLTPLPCKFWGVPPAPLLLQVARLISSVKCYHLHCGLPEETAQLVERIVRTN
jgi:hypothetical protein